MVASNWERGYGGDVRIGEYRSDSYREMKRLMNPSANGFVDLIYTGQYVSSLFIPNDDNIINVDASDSKRGKLVSDYGEGQFDLSETQERDVVDDAKDMVYEDIFAWLNG